MLKHVQSGKKLNIVVLYLHRYLRLTPVLGVVMLAYTYVLQHVTTGPLWIDFTSGMSAWCV